MDLKWPVQVVATEREGLQICWTESKLTDSHCRAMTLEAKSQSSSRLGIGRGLEVGKQIL